MYIYAYLNDLYEIPTNDRTIRPSRRAGIPTPPTMTVYHIDESDRPSAVVIRAIAEHTGTPAIDLEPLHRSIDPETLDSLVRDASQPRVVFTHRDVTVTIDAERIRVE